MKNVIDLLYTLQGLEMGPNPEAPEAVIETRRLRQKIPAPILGHYDRLRARDKKGVSLVRNGVCSECHMRLASGIHAEVIRAEDILICDNCGRYLFALKEEPAAPEQPKAESAPAAPPKAKKKRARKTGTTADAVPA